ncbi:hypothetical protein GCM10007424_00950 [Flavobacterium suaedae]|uniref:Ankyrin repeat domain-containing protein n=1 Tax=Flavobacterium suaedae TaxID=1767027 RepID=A0ABQ1JC50_9FLAO|nr:ankyrin repeat domain-containing protein [Flavobacterium suaedae]GGB64837.1 hypothetical protein GCM10007424_00950 [Flavobacterium suaedae]
MKKTIVYLSLALVTLSSATFASTTNLETPQAVSAVNYLKVTPLAQAICKGDMVAVKKFIEYGVDVNEKSNGVTPLMLAARYNNVEAIKLLIENGARLKTEDKNGYTAVKYAEMSNATEAQAYLQKALDA